MPEEGTGSSQETPPFNRKKTVAGILAQYDGDAEKAIGAMAKDMWTLRRKYRTSRERITALEDQLTEAKDTGLGAEDVVLKGQEAKDYEAIKALKLSATDITKLQETNTQLTDKVARAEREKGVTTAATALGYKPAVLLDLVDSKKLELEMRDIKVKDENEEKEVTKSLPHVRVTGDDKAAWEPLSKVVEEGMLKDYRLALETVAEDGDSETTIIPIRGTGPTRQGKPHQKEVAKKVVNQATSIFRAPGDKDPAANTK